MVMFVTDVPELQLPAEYARWQAHLEQALFADRLNQPVLMFVDREELNDLAADGEDGPRSLASAVRTVVDIERGRTMFDRVATAADRWERGLRLTPPPTLPVLAITALAASEMRADARGAAHNYYLRLAEVLLPDGTTDERQALREELDHGAPFENVVGMWQRIGKWLDERGGEYGVSTIPEDPRPFTRIGYPLSQTLLRRSDRAALTRFFDRMNLVRDGVPGPESLLYRLNLWMAHRPDGFSKTFLRAVADVDLNSYVKPLLHGLAMSWDGKVVTPEGLRRLEVRLTIDILRHGSWWVVPTAKDVLEDQLSGMVGGHTFDAALTPGYGGYYSVEGMPAIESEVLKSGFVAKGTYCVTEFHPSDLLVFVDSAEAGGWVSVDIVRAYDTYVFAARPDLEDDVDAALQLSADRGWCKLPGQIARQIVNGYVIYRNVSFSDRQRLSDALSLLQMKVAGTIQFGEATRARLAGGLSLLHEVGRNIYLSGGEPDLELPASEGPRPVLVAVDDQLQEFIASIFPIPLNVVPHDVGEHAVETGEGDLLTFRVIDGVGTDSAPPGAGSLGWTDGQLGVSSHLAVCGAVTSAPPTPAVALVRRGALKDWLIDQGGHAVEIHEPPAPTFLAGAIFGWFEVPRDRGCWLLRQFRLGWELVSLRPEEPHFGALSVVDRAIWQTAATTQVRGGDALWRRYIQEWDRAGGH